MAKIVFQPGCSFSNMPPSQSIKMVRQDVLATRIIQLAEQWELVAKDEGIPLAELQASVAALLADFVEICELG